MSASTRTPTSGDGIRRRDVLRLGALGVAGAAVPGFAVRGRRALAVPLASGLSDPLTQPMFVEPAPNALDPAFLFKDLSEKGRAAHKPNFSIAVRQGVQETGLVDPRSGRRLRTRIWGYGDRTVTWPGQTIQVVSASAGGADETIVRWTNGLQGKKHLLPVDENLHWCYSLHGPSSANGVDYRQYSIARNGVPIITHVHGGHTDFQYDGNPEFFYSPDGEVKGPQWDFVEGGFTTSFRYDNHVPAGALWYHDHALGITRLNVYAGLAGFYFVRDEVDTGMPGNDAGLPAFPYELAYAIQDRMFSDDGSLFYPAFPGDPAYDDFITEEGVTLPPELFPGGGPTALAEFFGDHMVVNGRIWPKQDVEPRHYRMRLLNGCDSRFLVLQFVAVPLGATTLTGAGSPLPFRVVGSDQGLGSVQETDTLVVEPGGRYDVVVDFGDPALAGTRVVMTNLGGDGPFGGAYGDDLEPEDLFPDRRTDRVMAFDVVRPVSSVPDTFTYDGGYAGVVGTPTTRKVALFEGMDEFGRLQPLLGTVDEDGTAAAYTWFQETTETPALGSTEVWEIYNFTMDAHPVHLHLVNFETLGRHEITFDADEENPQHVQQHNGSHGTVPAISNVEVGDAVEVGTEYYRDAPKDLVTALPGQMVKVKAHFDKAGRYVWHCHILSHEDHEMMRVLEVQPAD